VAPPSFDCGDGGAVSFQVSSIPVHPLAGQCNGTTNGPTIDADHDLVKALEQWVEQGIAPDQIVATHFTSTTPPTVAFQRPLCP
jgi:hypothetical protein